MKYINIVFAMGANRHQNAVALFFLLLTLCSAARTAESLSEDEVQALLAFKSSIRNSEIRLSSWQYEDRRLACSNWTGVSCRRNNANEGSINQITTMTVANLTLSGLGLQGEISPFLGNLTALRTLDLSNNQLRGTIPPQLTRLKQLTYLDLSSNSLSARLPAELPGCLRHVSIADNALVGAVPAAFTRNLTGLEYLDLSCNRLGGGAQVFGKSWGDMKNLRVLRLNSNDFAGRIVPDIVMKWRGLEELTLDNNSFEGEVPAELGLLASLRVLQLGQNQFSGSIPPSLGNLSSLRTLSLRQACFTGKLPAELGKLAEVRLLDVSGNGLSGAMPGSLGQLRSVASLLLSNNELQGPIPPSLANCSNLCLFEASWNRLEGGLPPSLLPTLSALVSFAVEGNHLSGPLLKPSTSSSQLHNHPSAAPSSSTSCSRSLLGVLLLGSNFFHGPIPAPFLSQFPLLHSLSLSHNNLSGPLPPHLCLISTQLSYLELSSNSLSGDLSLSFCGCTSLSTLDLSSNSLSGSIPSNLSKLPLAVLNLENNKLSGTIPDDLWTSQTLLAVELAGNRLEGSLSQFVGNLSSLQQLTLDHNLLHGSIPDHLGKLKNLQMLSLSYNNFTGLIPGQLYKCASLTTLNLAANQLTGSVSPEIGKLASLNYLNLGHNRLSGVIPSQISLLFHNLGTPPIYDSLHSDTLDLSFNGLRGSIPASIGDCRALQRLILSSNELTGLIPPEMAKLSSLTHLDLLGNRLSGEIPDGVCKLKHLVTLNVSSLINNNGTCHRFHSSSKRTNFCRKDVLACTSTASMSKTTNQHFVDGCEEKPDCVLLTAGIVLAVLIVVLIGGVALLWNFRERNRTVPHCDLTSGFTTSIDSSSKPSPGPVLDTPPPPKPVASSAQIADPSLFHPHLLFKLNSCSLVKSA